MLLNKTLSTLLASSLDNALGLFEERGSAMGGTGPEDDSIRVPSQAFFVDGSQQHVGAEGVTGAADMPAAKAEHIHLELGEPLQLMEPVPKDKVMALEFPNISAWVPDLFGAASKKQSLLGKAFGMLHLSRSTQPRNSKPRERQVCFACS